MNICKIESDKRSEKRWQVRENVPQRERERELIEWMENRSFKFCFFLGLRIPRFEVEVLKVMIFYFYEGLRLW